MLHNVYEVSIEASYTRMFKRRKMRRTDQDARSVYVHHAVKSEGNPTKTRID
jgi:hypothetical protein